MPLQQLSACVWPPGFTQLINILLETRVRNQKTEWTGGTMLSQASA